MAMPSVATGTILDHILRRTSADLATRKAVTPITALERRARERPTPVSLRAALSRPGLGIIAEIKRASPSRGRFPAEIDPADVASDYLAGGAVALSVLTDEPFFQGSLGDLAIAANVAHLHAPPAPVLRKDFVIDEYQLVEALTYGADAVLLIVAALTQVDLVRLLATTRNLGLEALVEVHDAQEMTRAIEAGADVIGINNRDLRTFHVDLAVTERLAPLAPPGTVLVGESGIFTAGEARRLAAAGVHAVLVGESLILSSDRAAAVRALAAAGEQEQP